MGDGDSTQFTGSVRIEIQLGRRGGYFASAMAPLEPVQSIVIAAEKTEYRPISAEKIDRPGAFALLHTRV
jgi:hypothetical protein